MFDLTLTFDNGPDSEVTPRVLDVLGRHGVGTTFFVLGRTLTDRAARACAARAHAEGHLIGNHTFSHGRPLGERPGIAAVREEIERTQAEIGALAHDPPLFRPNGGGNLDRRLLSEDAASALQAAGYSCVLWNAIPRDWADPVGWVKTALQQVTEQPWTLMVLHDIAGAGMDHLDGFLAEVADRGGRFRHDFPPVCVPITAGRVTGPLADFVTVAPPEFYSK